MNVFPEQVDVSRTIIKRISIDGLIVKAKGLKK